MALCHHIRPVQRTLPEHRDHGVDVLLVQRRHDHPPAHFPHLPIGRNQTRPHDKVQDLGQKPLGVVVSVLPQDVLCHLCIRHDDERLWPEAQPEHLAVYLEQRVQRDEHRLPDDLPDVPGRHGHALRRNSPPLLTQLGQPHRQHAADPQRLLRKRLANGTGHLLLRRARVVKLPGRDSLVQGQVRILLRQRSRHQRPRPARKRHQPA
mmetsp:Transcript_6322/g.17465  ORF Transcript_6322/g.17465 Transcript_6322/m.17465 type:complete len:207 (+) Transcript_6322:2502-3122(+)